ncbi:MAG: EamA family transporter [Ancalomicrobiaceae bacterium]|nr:EamA family transporter [Ancalomicrobiaceae bacterium]
MKLPHILIAVGLTVIWGLNFIAIRIGLNHMPPLFFAGLRFVIAGLPILVVPRPKMALGRLMAISATMFVAQFGFLFPGMQVGFPPGLASLTLQVQSVFTVLLAAAFIGERPAWRNLVGLMVAFAGLALIASTVGTGGVTMAGFGLIMASAFGWSMGNVVLRASPKVDMFPLIAWISALAILPLLALSLVLEGPGADLEALVQMNWGGASALAYVAILSTLGGYWAWAELLKRYPAGLVSPFALLVPVSGTLSAYLILGESFGPLRLAGMVLILAGLAINTLPIERIWRRG